jgi:hypothetical protein
MGASNVSAAFRMYPDLPHRAFRLLAYMALVSLDEDRPDAPARISWIGREALAEALGFSVPPEPDVDDTSVDAEVARVRRHGAFVVLGTAIRELIAAGAIERVRAGGRNRTAEYRINVDPFTQGQRGVAPDRQRGVAPKGQRGVAPKGQRGVAPEEDRGTTEEYQGGQPRLSQPSHLPDPQAVDQGEIDRGLLAKLGPDQQQAYLDAAHREGITETAAMIHRAVELAEVRPAMPGRFRDLVRQRLYPEAVAR